MGRQPASAALQFWMKLMGGTFVVLLLTVWEHVEALREERQVKILRLEADRLTYENGRMQMQIHQWVSPGHLESVARKEFGMVPLDAAHVIGLNKQ
jgi:hypothetical protein